MAGTCRAGHSADTGDWVLIDRWNIVLLKWWDVRRDSYEAGSDIVEVEL